MKQRPIIFNTDMVRALLDGRKTQTRRPVSKAVEENIRLHAGEDGSDESSEVEFIYAKHSDDDGEAQPEEWLCYLQEYPEEGVIAIGQCPFGQPGDQLWVRETFLPDPNSQDDAWDDHHISYFSWSGCGSSIRDVPSALRSPDNCIYKASWVGTDLLWKPSIHMPRWASRITLEITNIRVERVQDITEADAIAEGLNRVSHGPEGTFYSWQRNYPHPQNYCHSDDAYQDLWCSIYGPEAWDRNEWVWVIEFKRIEGK